MPRPDLDRLPGMKLADFERCARHGACISCGQPAGTAGLTFYRLRLERLIFDAGAIRRQVGLANMLGSAGLAAVMGPDEDMAKRIGGPFEVVLCEGCAGSDMAVVPILMETATAEAETASAATPETPNAQS